MIIITFLTSIAGATMLLLFAVYLVRTGIERSYGARFQRMMSGERGVVQAGMLGIMLAVVLQSSAAVALLTTGFAATGMLSFGTGFAIVLGGDLGSALIIQVLSFDIQWLVPALLAVGGWLFVKTEQKKLRQAGRVIMGIALILVSLQFLRDAMEPIRDSSFLPVISDYLARDYITAFLVGGALAFLMHSSVAAILMCVTLVQVGALPFAAGLSLVLGANLGSALIPVWLTRGMALRARRIVFANLGMRGAWALVALFAVNGVLDMSGLQAYDPAQMLITAHIAFNGSLLLMVLPFCHVLRGPFEWLLPDMPDGAAAQTVVRVETALDPKDFGTPSQAIASLKRELLHMTELVEAMFRPVMSLYRTGEKEQIRAVQSHDQEVNACLARIRGFVAGLPADGMTKQTLRSATDMLEYAIRLETAGDVVAERLTVLAGRLRKTQGGFSKDGWAELQAMHENILDNMRLALNVLISDDLESARLLNIEKTETKRAERQSRKRHFQRLQAGEPLSIASSDIHLETLRALRDFNSNIAAVATPILYANGQLLETRLINEIAQKPDDE